MCELQPSTVRCQLGYLLLQGLPMMAAVPATWESLPPGPKWATKQKGLVVTGRVSFLCVQGSLSVGGGRGNQVARGPLCHLITCEARRCPSPCFKPEIRVPRRLHQGHTAGSQGSVSINLFSLRPQFYLQPPTACHNSVYFMFKKKKEPRALQSCVLYKNER